ncbi:recombinase family protein [Caproicibacter fermentans]|uniref:recombinase family protein n=1 Tax=Caproicibacter fermentans TaxID=2576756 RepID=UPI001412451A|nr:recombinase family protein [Caproicibacter fermentans]
MKNAVIYARYSSDAQKETSIDDQIRDCNKFAADNNYRIIHIYRDDCVSGKTDNRDQFQQMLSDSAKELFETVIVWKLDRFARNRNESALNKVKLKKNGVKVVSAMEHIPDGPEGIILESVLEGMAEYYIYDLMEKTTRGRIGVALQCKHTGGRPLLGYKVNPDKTYSIDEYNAETIRQIFHMYATGSSFSEIIDEMNRQGRKTASGRSFGKNSIHELLRNERFIGIFTYNKIPSENGKRNSHASKPKDKVIRIPDGIPAIVSMDEWNTVQQKMQKNKHTQARYKAKIEYLLSGKIFCGECGGAMVGQSSGSHEKYSYYECSTKKRLRTCSKSNVKKETIEAAVINYTIDYILSEEFRESLVDLILQQDDERQKSARLITGLKEKIGQNQTAKDNIIKAIEAGIFTSTTKEKLEALEAESDLLNSQLLEAETMQSPTYTKEAISVWLSKIATKARKSESGNKFLLYSFVSAVYVYDDGTVKILYNLGNKEQKIALSDLNGAGDRT